MIQVSSQVPLTKEHGYARLNPDRVGDGQIISDNLNTGRLSQVSPGTPVILVEGVFNGDDVVLLGVGNVEVGKFDSGEPFRGVGVGVLEAITIEWLELLA